jgi:uncharacterized protein (DUF362 family)
MGMVSIAKTDRGIKEGLQQALSLLGGLRRFINHNDTVMLKPNINGTEGVTDKTLIEALIQLLSDFKVGKIILAESTFGTSRETQACFDATGYTKLAQKYNIELLNLNKSAFIETKVKNPLVLNSIRIAKEVLEVDSIINVPVMKVHYATAVTLALKNLKGLLVGEEKRHFHQVGLEKAIVDLNNTIKPALNIIDATSCMERMGPRGGDIVNLNLVIAGEHAVEVDYVGATIMGFAISEVKHLQYYIGYNDIDVGAIELLGERIAEVKHNFKKVTMDTVIPKEFTVHEINACCACMNALLLSCQFLGKRRLQKTHVYLGTKIPESEAAKGLRIAFGNCSLKAPYIDIAIPGCPPYPFDLKTALAKKAVKKRKGR